MPGWRNGRRRGLKILHSKGVWVRIPLPAPKIQLQGINPGFFLWIPRFHLSLTMFELQPAPGPAGSGGECGYICHGESVKLESHPFPIPSLHSIPYIVSIKCMGLAVYYMSWGQTTHKKAAMRQTRYTRW